MEALAQHIPPRTQGAAVPRLAGSVALPGQERVAEAQAARLVAAFRRDGRYTARGMERLLRQYGYRDAREVFAADLDMLLAYASDPVMGEAWSARGLVEEARPVREREHLSEAPAGHPWQIAVAYCLVSDATVVDTARTAIARLDAAHAEGRTLRQDGAALVAARTALAELAFRLDGYRSLALRLDEAMSTALAAAETFARPDGTAFPAHLYHQS